MRANTKITTEMLDDRNRYLMVISNLTDVPSDAILGKSRLTDIVTACEWLEKKACLYVWKNCEQGEHGIHKIMLEDFRKAMKGD